MLFEMVSGVGPGISVLDAGGDRRDLQLPLLTIGVTFKFKSYI